MGRTKVQHTIQINLEEPIKLYVPRHTPAMVETNNNEIRKLEKVEFIEPSILSFSAPTVCVKKPDGALQVCIDFQMLNKNIINDAYPLHQIDDQLNHM